METLMVSLSIISDSLPLYIIVILGNHFLLNYKDKFSPEMREEMRDVCGPIERCRDALLEYLVKKTAGGDDSDTDEDEEDEENADTHDDKEKKEVDLKKRDPWLQRVVAESRRAAESDPSSSH
jgi:hypothetical protein